MSRGRTVMPILAPDVGLVPCSSRRLQSGNGSGDECDAFTSIPITMALWKDSSASVKEPAKDQANDLTKAPGAINLAPPNGFANPAMPEVPEMPLPAMPEPAMAPMLANAAPMREMGMREPGMRESAMREPEMRRTESVLTNELTIEGKIEGSGNVRIAGKFKGEVNVQGNLVIEQGAVVTANVRAQTITIAGQLEGNIEGAMRVELLESGVLTGDVMADSLTVAAGSRMRGKADFGWNDKPARKS